ncbi:M81 family metallopeptidase [Actinoplanes rectilineatus]|uniref:M81 family metallopeptidase n=1 Tax=Actinoplanes rectilineatus TaxID=113571 RepID=UPI0012FBB5CC
MGGPVRIAIAGMHIESSAYAAHRASFRDFSVLSGPQVLARYDFLDPAAEWIGILHARSIPGGKVLREVYDEFKQRILDGLRDAGPIDGLYFDIHGAMSVDGMDDAEGDLITAIRAVIGPDVLVSAPMDLHGNVSERFARAVELPTCYRLAPHEDAGETRERAARHLVEHLAAGKRPHRAWVRVPILLPGEKTSTRVEPAKSLYGSLAAIEAREGVTDASIWIGYAWADEPRCHATVIVTGDSSSVIAAAASELASRLWEARDDFGFVGPPGSLEDAVSRALASPTRPYLISDSGDNPGAGGSGDVTWTLSHLLSDISRFDGCLVYVASIFDTAAVEILFGHRVGDQVSVTAGARVDSRVSGPVPISGTLHGLHTGDPDAGRIAVVRCGGLHVIVTEFRKAYHHVDDFTAIGLDPAAADIIVTKIGYLEPTLYDIANGWTLALTPGPVDQDLARLGHHRIERPMFPFDAFPAEPALTVTML